MQGTSFTEAQARAVAALLNRMEGIEPVTWQPTESPWSEQAIRGDYKAVTLRKRKPDGRFSWMLFGPPRYANVIQYGSCDTLDEAKEEAAVGLPRST